MEGRCGNCTEEIGEGAAPAKGGASRLGNSGETSRKRSADMKPLRFRPKPALCRNPPEWRGARGAEGVHDKAGEEQEEDDTGTEESWSKIPPFGGDSAGSRFRVSAKCADESDAALGVSGRAPREATTTASEADDACEGTDESAQQSAFPRFLPHGRVKHLEPAGCQSSQHGATHLAGRSVLVSVSTPSRRQVFARRVSLFCMRQTIRLLRFLRFLWAALARAVLPVSLVELVESHTRRASILVICKSREKNEDACSPRSPSLSPSAFPSVSSPVALTSELRAAGGREQRGGTASPRVLRERKARDEDGEADLLRLTPEELLTLATEAWEWVSLPSVQVALSSSSPVQFAKRRALAWVEPLKASREWAFPDSDEWRLSLFGATEERQRLASPAAGPCVLSGGELQSEEETCETREAERRERHGGSDAQDTHKRERSPLSVCAFFVSAVAVLKRKAVNQFEAAAAWLPQEFTELAAAALDRYNCMHEALRGLRALLTELEGKARQLVNEGVSVSSLSRFVSETLACVSRQARQTPAEAPANPAEADEREHESDSEEEVSDDDMHPRGQSMLERLRKACDRAQTWHVEAFDLAQTVLAESCKKLTNRVKRTVSDGRALFHAAYALLCGLLRGPVKSFQVLAMPDSPVA
ncbi:conserved hypothetical protein [Neospora caninum Liverpool]|uniref:Uncharacterized protein n=1 Tax=Neospora caninum (strain Liverpool) TaxID=572307 RepID=F0V7N9_NEOCL|nr:conserved hypothetical protein [Neospora caninum Liverpool]CBZ49730.1 conserved hypothetical protein [Neospora caninum Liverpool]CEL64314.1 TPA: hypothetical protein BN1204_002170 [Neospora caninum Liverpool]|eukprot:XP_003879765.1 conserved hypothetical protein [Neospora caninum Liverpool]